MLLSSDVAIMCESAFEFNTLTGLREAPVSHTCSSTFFGYGFHQCVSVVLFTYCEDPWCQKRERVWRHVASVPSLPVPSIGRQWDIDITRILAFFSSVWSRWSAELHDSVYQIYCWNWWWLISCIIGFWQFINLLIIWLFQLDPTSCLQYCDVQENLTPPPSVDHCD